MLRHRRSFALALVVALLAVFVPARGEDKSEAPPKGLRVLSCGHSFHFFLPPIVTDIAKGAKITDHKQAGLSAIGGSRVHQHWDVAGGVAEWGKQEYFVDITFNPKDKSAVARVVVKGNKLAPIKAEKL